MAKKKSVLLILIVMLAFFAFAGLASCGVPTVGPDSETISETPEVKYTVKFMNGTAEVASVEVKEGETIAQADIPADPASEYVFYGWFNGETEFDAAAAVTADVTYVAKFSTIKAEFIGEWRGEGKDDYMNPVAYVLNVTGEAVSFKLGAADAVAATDIVNNEEYGSLDFTAGEVAYSFGQSWGAYMIMSVEDYSVSGYMSLVYDKAISADETSGLVGKFVTDMETEIVINSTFVLIDGVQGTEFEFDDSALKYTFYLDYEERTIEYSSYTGEWKLLGGYYDEVIDTNIGDPVEIPAALIGNWSGVYEDDWGKTLYLVTITSDGISVYTDAVGWSKVVASYEAVEGGVVFKIGGDKVAVTANADGTINYDGDYVNVVLDKKIRIAFVNDYQIYYIATLKDDGTIDEDNFAFDDPTKAHYHFDGWFNQIDNAEFDETATFEKGAYFEAKWTETEIPVEFGDTTVYVPLVDGVAKLTEALIPAAPEAEEGKAFMGWYNGDVKAVAGLEVKKNAKFVSYFAAEADYDKYWIISESGKETMLFVDVANKKFSFEEATDVTYTYKNGILEGTKNGHTITVTKTLTGVTLVDRSWDDVEEDFVNVEYKLVQPKLVSGLTGGIYRLDKVNILTITDQGIVTTYDGSSSIYYGYVSGTKSNMTFTYRTSKGAGSTVKTKTGITLDKDGNLLFGNYKDDPAMYIFGSEAEAYKQFYCSADGTYLYAHKVGEKMVYVYKNADGKYGMVTSLTGDLSVGSVITIEYRLYLGQSAAKSQKFTVKYKITKDSTTEGAMVLPSEEKGEYTSETLGTLKLDGFGNATLTNGDAVETYVYVINGAGVLLLKNADGEIVKGIALGEENKFDEATPIKSGCFYTDDKYYKLTLDGFGGAIIVAKTAEYVGSYSIGDGVIEIKGIDLYNGGGTFTLEEDGKVLVGEKKIFIADGYTPVNHINEFAGYYVNGDDVVKIVVADGKATVLVNGVDVKAKANWNGTELVYTAVDADSPVENVSVNYILVLDGEKLLRKHLHCTGKDMDGFNEFDTEYTVEEFTAAKEPAEPEELDGLQGTYKADSNVIVLNGDGTGTYNDGYSEYSFTYTLKSNGVYSVSSFGAFDGDSNTFTVTANGLKIDLADSYVEFTYSATFVKQAEETEELDGLQGTYKAGSNIIVFNGDGTGTYNNGTEYSFTYTLNSGSKYDVSNFAGYDDDENTITITATGLTVHFSGSCGDDVYNATFVKQA